MSWPVTNHSERLSSGMNSSMNLAFSWTQQITRISLAKLDVRPYYSFHTSLYFVKLSEMMSFLLSSSSNLSFSLISSSIAIWFALINKQLNLVSVVVRIFDNDACKFYCTSRPNSLQLQSPAIFGPRWVLVHRWAVSQLHPVRISFFLPPRCAFGS